MHKKLVSLALLVAFLPTAAIAQDKSSRYDRALAAGYKAQFICSGLWNGGKSLADIKADELTGIYKKIADIVPELQEEIDETERQVRVAFADDAPPRTAIWNRKTGCTSMPIGFDGLKRGVPVRQTEFFDDQPWPMGDLNATAATSDKDSALQTAAAGAFDSDVYGGKTSAVLIIKDGLIQSEIYKSGHDKHTAQRTWSVAKSMAGTLIGHSVQQKMVDIDAPILIPEWQKFADPRASLTIDILMRMGSGLTSDTAGNRTDAIYIGGASVTERAISWPLLYRPGSRFRYANNDTMLAVHAARLQHLEWRNKLGNYMPEEHDFNPHGFFRKLGMTRTFAETDWQGNYILSSQVWSTARDVGRMGLLYLANGMWNGERLLPDYWRALVSDPSGPQPKSGKFQYGGTFWLMNQSKDIPADTFAAIGNRGQFLVIIPSLDLIIVRRGYDSSDSRFDIETFTRKVVAQIQ